MEDDIAKLIGAMLTAQDTFRSALIRAAGMNSVKWDLEAQCKEIIAQVEAKRAELAEVEAKLSEAEAKLTSLSNEIGTMEKRNAELRADHDRHVRDVERVKEKLEAA